MANNLSFFSIHADDLDRARGFYEQVFGWRFEPWGPPGFYLIHTGDAQNPYNGHGQPYWTYGIPEAVHRWAGHDGCDGAPTVIRTAPGVTLTALTAPEPAERCAPPAIQARRRA